MSEQESLESKKELAHYTTVLQAWVATRMEKDRTLLTLATGGIGLLATLLKTVGPDSSTELVLYALAGVSFVVTIVAAIRIFERNSQHLQDVIVNGKRDDDPILVRLDRVVFGSFVLGVILTGAIALLSGYTHPRKDASMPHEDRETTKIMSGTEQKSLTGIGKLAPATQPAASQGTGSSSDQGTSVVRPGSAGNEGKR